MFNKYLQYVWYICTDNLIPIAPYTSIGTLDIDRTVQIPTEPLEGGKLMAYNNVQEPSRVNVTLYFNGDYAVQVLALAMLDDVIANAKTCTIFTPTWIWRNMALDHYDYSRANNGGATLLSVVCSFQEIRSITVETQTYSTSTVKKSTSVSKVSTGQISSQTTTKSSVYYSAGDSLKNSAKSLLGW